MGAHPTLLFTGASGLVGASLYRAIGSSGRPLLERWRCVLAVHRRSAPGPLRRGDRAVKVDLAERGAAARLAELVEPQAIVHAAALASLPACERDPDAARRLNVESTAELARVCAATGAHLVLLSSDQVFGGDREWTGGAPPGYREEDEPAPRTLYGRTKLEAERAALAIDVEALVLRASLVLAPSADGRSGALDMVRAARGTDDVRLFADEWRTPVSVLDLARVVGEAIARRAAGVLHVAGPERASRLELGERIAKAFHAAGGEAPRLVAAQQREAGHARPRDVSLATPRLEREGWPRPAPLDAALAELRELIERGLAPRGR